MESLALLCTLHADGPATLHRLRRAGCFDLPSLEALDASELARLAGCSPAAARRLASEAKHLRERLVPEGTEPSLEQEEAPEAWSGSQDPVSVPPSRLDSKDRALIDRVLSGSRAEAPVPTEANPAGGAAPEVARAGAQAEFAAGVLEAPASDAVTPALEASGEEPVPSPEVHEETPSLVAGAIDGLTEELVEALVAAGYLHLEDLAAAESSDLATAANLAFGPAARLRFLARRAVEDAAPAEVTQEFGALVFDSVVEESEEPSSPAIAADQSEALETLEPGDALSPSADPLATPLAEDAWSVVVDWSAEPAAGAPTESTLNPAADAPGAEAQEAIESAGAAQLESPSMPEAGPGSGPALELGAPSLVDEPLEFEAPVPIDEDPTVRPPFWQVRAAWQGQQEEVSAVPATPSPQVQPADAADGTPDSAAHPAEGTALGWDFVVPTTEPRPRTAPQRDEEGVGGPFA